MIHETCHWGCPLPPPLSPRLVKAHGLLILYQNMLVAASRVPVGATTAVVLRKLACLFALTQLEAQHLGDLMEDGFLSGAQTAALRDHQRALLLELRPDAVALVDAFGFEDYALNSALGRYDGDVYRALLEMAQGSPLNATEEGPAWHDVLKPVMTARSKL